jgi:hypothetical protein
VDYELAGSRAQIDAQITTQKTISLAYPYGDSNASVVSIARNYYIFARGISCGLNSDPYDYYNLKACSPDVGDDIYAQADAAELQRKLLVVYIHSLDEEGLLGSRSSIWNIISDYPGARTHGSNLPAPP